MDKIDKMDVCLGPTWPRGPPVTITHYSGADVNIIWYCIKIKSEIGRDHHHFSPNYIGGGDAPTPPFIAITITK